MSRGLFGSVHEIKYKYADFYNKFVVINVQSSRILIPFHDPRIFKIQYVNFLSALIIIINKSSILFKMLASI